LTKDADNRTVPPHVIGLVCPGITKCAEDDVSLYVSTGLFAPG